MHGEKLCLMQSISSPKLRHQRIVVFSTQTTQLMCMNQEAWQRREVPFLPGCSVYRALCVLEEMSLVQMRSSHCKLHKKKKINAFLSATSVVLGGLWEELHSWPDGNSLLRSNHRHAFWWHLQAEEQVAASFFGVVTNSANKTRHFHHKGCQSAIQIDIVTSPEAKNYRSLFFPAYNPAVPAVQKTIFLQILPTFDPEEHLLTSVLTPTLALLPTWHRDNADMSDRHR